MPAISVIVPVYNVQEYLPACVDSILSQTFNDYELILVDDGSPDACGDICDEYAKKDERVHVIHKKNGGLADARNSGIDSAKGAYLTFIDSDDIIYKDYLKYLYDAALAYGAEIVQGMITTHLDQLGQTGTDRHHKTYDVRILAGEDAIRDYLMYRTYYSTATFKLIKRELFEGVRFPVGKYSEDEFTTYKLVLKSKKGVCLPEYVYYYRLREGSIVRSYNTKRFEVCDELPELIEKAVNDAGFHCPSELDYKNMRIQLKIYNDFVQGGQYAAFREKLQTLEKRIRQIRVDHAAWDKKYILIHFAVSYMPWLYRNAVHRFRSILS